MTHCISRRHLLAAAGALALVPGAALADGPIVEVAKSPTCGCCTAWIEHMRAAGFTVNVTDVEYDALQQVKTRLGIGPDHASCHTARVDGYVIEGHVPAEDVRRLLAERPDAVGLAVPGMPVGSPGMEMGNERDPYDTILVRRDGTGEVFQSHRD